MAGEVFGQDVRIDRQGLAREHDQRSNLTDAAFQPAAATDWSVVRQSLAAVNADVG